MKPKDLKYPFPFEERRPMMGEQILYVPKYYDTHDAFLMPSFQEIFGNSNPVHVEFCSGNGMWIFEQAKERPDVNFIAVEMDFERVRKIYAKCRNAGLSNILVVSGKAEPFIKWYVPKGSISTAYVNFPDPWPKDRHAKHRIIKAPFIEDVCTALEPCGQLHLVTDDPPYAQEMQSVLQSVEGFQAHPLELLPENHSYGESWFEKLWRSKGKEIFHMVYEREGVVCLSS